MTNQEAQALRIKNTIFLSRPCVKCNGKLYIDSDQAGYFIKCLNCGLEKNLDPISKTERQDWSLTKRNAKKVEVAK